MMSQTPITHQKRHRADHGPRFSRCPRPSLRRLVEVAPGACASCTGTRTRTNGSTTSRTGPHGRVRGVGQARTFDFQANDVGYVPFAMGTISRTPATRRSASWRFFKSDYYADVSPRISW
jgi:oxalate decarboxylase